MTDKQYTVAQFRLDVRRAEIAVATAKEELEAEEVRLAARTNKILAQLRENYEQAVLTLESEKLHLKQAVENAEKGYDE